jgi:membrane protein DedA with SNARE-associated domain
LVAGIRTKLAIVSGSTRMPFHRYVLADAAGAAVWAVGVGLTGYLFADAVAHLSERFSDAGHWVAVAAFAVVTGAVVWLSVRYVLRYRPTAGA